ncbi:MAG: SDR family NAD(P)-dependent oxidoreductase [Chromatiaceae bacterium]|nr:SDR family NAD(P)-dependent oxidoreductase [Chromatiaceae bacterium]
MARFEATCGLPDFLFNCAGRAEPGYIQDYSLDAYEAAMRVDYLGTVIPTQYLLPDFIARGSGHIINVSSVAGFLGLIGYGTYAPAKFAVVGFSEVLRHEMKPHGVRVSVVCPPDVDTRDLRRRTAPSRRSALRYQAGHGSCGRKMSRVPCSTGAQEPVLHTPRQGRAAVPLEGHGSRSGARGTRPRIAQGTWTIGPCGREPAAA